MPGAGNVFLVVKYMHAGCRNFFRYYYAETKKKSDAVRGLNDRY